MQRHCTVTSFQKRLDQCNPRSCPALHSRNKQIGTSCATCFQRTFQIRTTAQEKNGSVCGPYLIRGLVRPQRVLLWLVHNWVCLWRIQLTLTRCHLLGAVGSAANVFLPQDNVGMFFENKHQLICLGVPKGCPG